GNSAIASAVVFGDNATIRWSNSGALLEARSIDFVAGGADHVNLIAGSNTVFGGAQADIITSANGVNTILGDDGEIYFRSDRSIRLIQSINLGSGSDDQITLQSGTNHVIAGFGADAIKLNGGANYVLGDEGRFEVLSNGGEPTGFTILESVNGSSGGVDDIDIGSGFSLVVGGAAGDKIDVLGGSANSSSVVFGDNATIRWSNSGVLLEARSINFSEGGADTVNITAGSNAVIGGSAADILVSENGFNTILGDDAEVYFQSDRSIRLIQSINLGAGANDQITLRNGANRVVAGFGDDSIDIQGGNNYVLGDEGKFEVLTSSGNLTGITTLESINGSIGGGDDIHVVAGRNVVIGGAAGDSIDLHAIPLNVLTVALGDNGLVTVSNSGSLLEVRSNEFGQGGADTINVVGGSNAVFGGVGADTISIATGSNLAFGDDAVATFFSDGSIQSIESINLGSGGADSIAATGGTNRIYGGHNDDQITIHAGNAWVFGDEGRYEVTQRTLGDSAAFTLRSMNSLQGGKDTVSIAAGRVVALGGGSDDAIQATQGSTATVTALGDGGEVILDSQERPVRIRSIELGAGGHDQILLGNQDDIMAGGFGNDLIQTGEGNNIALGDTIELLWDLYGSNRVLTFISASSEDPATAGDDTIVGSSGSDVLFGGNGSDTIKGGAGEDVLASHNATLYLPIPQMGSVSGWGTNQVPKILGSDLSLTATEYLLPLNIQGDIGDGSDTLYGDAGNDILLTTPGGHDVVYDLTGYDTISFQLARQAVFFDLDYLNQRQYALTPGGASG
ncbi:MAG: beta strand repeat-containing protein, partial [Pirellula sp.]